MAVLIKEEIGCKQCLICGKKINDCEASILLKVGDEIVSLHPICARSISLDLLRDLSTLANLGYEVE